MLGRSIRRAKEKETLNIEEIDANIFGVGVHGYKLGLNIGMGGAIRTSGGYEGKNDENDGMI
ncbi:hypothetical protein BOTNAR_0261g00040 [Botryotinia narcissicola]|uniref:Uncharacterized protein n=1 Tax=Botryotinia narcissicola TaxID=278944 RepID=A0A4Z1HZT4_9HELO|nr:hypothetical protein BOTNAR_0261g00040 [Botryotinia narcissicola]